MGNFNINIQGVGAYDTYEFKQTVYDFISRLKERGQNIQSATCTAGGVHDFLRNFTSHEIVASQECKSCECSCETKTDQTS